MRKNVRFTQPLTAACALLLGVAVSVWAYQRLASKLSDSRRVHTNTNNEYEPQVAKLKHATITLSEVHARNNYATERSKSRDHIVSVAPDRVGDHDGNGKIEVLTAESTQEYLGSPLSPERLGFSNQPRILISSATAEEQETFLTLKRQINDPEFLSSLSLEKLVSMSTFRSLPSELRLVILGKAVEKYNSGEIASDVFSLPPAGRQEITAN